MANWSEPIPDIAGTILAARAWSVRNGRLLPIFSGYSDHRATYGVWPEHHDIESEPWASSRMQVALHRQVGGDLSADDHICPGKDGVCGFWGLTTPEDLSERLCTSGPLSGDCPQVVGTKRRFRRWQPGSLIFGTVELWGRVIPGGEGWRASRARVAGLIAVSHPDAHRIARRYRVPLLACWPELTPAYQPTEATLEHR